MKCSYCYNPEIVNGKGKYTFEEIRRLRNPNLTKAAFLGWMTRTKNITLGRALGQFVGIEFIPDVCKKLFFDTRVKAEKE